MLLRHSILMVIIRQKIVGTAPGANNAFPIPRRRENDAH